MTTVAGTGKLVDAGVGLLDRERIIAKAGFNRWLVPPAALCIHLCIGMAYGFSVFWLPLSRALGVTAAKTCPDIYAGAGAFHDHLRLAHRQHGLDVHTVLRRAGRSAARMGRLARARRPAQSRRRCRVLLVRRPRARRHRHLHPSTLADVARLRRDRRHRARSRLHLAGVDLGQMVSRPARHGDRHGHHGLRRRRDDRRSARQPADELFQDVDLGRRMADVPDHGRHLLLLHDGRRVPLSAAAGRLAAGRLDAADAKPRR